MHRISSSSSLNSTINYMNQVYKFSFFFIKIYFNIILLSAPYNLTLLLTSYFLPIFLCFIFLSIHALIAGFHTPFFYLTFLECMMDRNHESAH